MNTHTPLTAALALAAVGAPLVCQAQDPAGEYKNILMYKQQNKYAEALATVDRVIAVYGNPKSRVAKQFAHYTPFFYSQKGEILMAMGKMDEAYAVFDELYTKEDYKSKELLERSKELPGQKEEGFLPLISSALFQMGNIRYQQAVGRNGQGGDPTKFDDCIARLEDYLKKYESKKVSKKELAQKLDGKVCFILMQSYLLKPQPDFAKAGFYIDKGRKAKAALPDDLVMNGLNTVLSIALKSPEYIEWGEKMISSNPAGFRLSPDRMAAHGGNIFNSGVKASKLWEEAMKTGDLKQAANAARTTYSLFGLVPDTAETVKTLDSIIKAVGNASQIIPDKALGVTYDPAKLKRLGQNYEGYISENTELDGYMLLTLANTAAQSMGSKRLGKAGYKILLERYPKLTQKKGDEKQVLLDINRLQYAQLSRQTGDEDTATAQEKMIDVKNVGEGNKSAVVLNEMVRLVREKRWDEVVPVADNVMDTLAAEKGSVNYVSANFSKLAALYMLRRYSDVVKVGEELLNSGMLTLGKLNEKQVNEYETQALFFVTDACKELAAKDNSYLDKSIAYAETFMKKYPSMNLEGNPMAPNVYFDAVTVLLKRRGHGKPEADKQDLQKALEYCDIIGKQWPEHDLYPTARLLAGSILINGEDDSVKPNGLLALEEAADGAVKQADGKGKGVAANALFWLASYSPEFPREGESEEALTARISEYFDRFWKDADYEGNGFALQMAPLQLSRALSAKDTAAYEKALKITQEIIAREATYAFKNNQPNPELEKTINSYVESYVNGEKTLHNKELTLDEKSAHLRNFPGVDKNDKFTNAIFHMALLTSMQNALTAAKRAGDDAAARQLGEDIKNCFAQMRSSFKPQDLTNYICVQVGNYQVDAAAQMSVANRQRDVESALSYFEQVLARGGDMLSEATLGKANALALADSDAQHKEAFDLYTKLTAAKDPSIAGPALMGLTKLNMTTKNYKAAVESASRFVDMRGAGTAGQRMTMMLMLGEAYCASGDVQKGLQTYMNLYSQNRGNITYSAPACEAMMAQLWKRNTPASGDRLKGTFKQSDRWRAWNTGRDYVTQVRRSGIEAKMTPAERDLFNSVVKLVNQYENDPAVQKEEKEKNAFQAQLSK